MQDQQTDAAIPEPVLAQNSLGRDWFLSNVVRLVNATGSRFGITLYVGSGLISGMLVGGDVYFEEMAKQFGGLSKDEEMSKNMHDWVYAHGALYRDQKTEGSDEVADAAEDPQFIHLLNAKLYVPGQLPIPTGKGGVLWRGNLNQVSGFSLGQLGVKE